MTEVEKLWDCFAYIKKIKKSNIFVGKRSA